MGWFLLIMKMIFSFFALLWNGFAKIINGIISLINKNTRKKIDRINRGVIEKKHSSIGELLNANNEINNTLISGGNIRERSQWISELIINMHSQGIPTIVIHENNDYLKTTLTSRIATNSIAFIDNNSPQLEPFLSCSAKEITKLLVETATTDYDIKNNARYYIEGMCDYLRVKKLQPTLRMFYKCPHGQLFDFIDDLINNGKITDTQGQAIKSKLMMGQSEQFKVESLISDLYDQAEPLLARNPKLRKNIVNAVKNNKIIVINISSNANALLIGMLLVQVRNELRKGKELALITDNLSCSSTEALKKCFVEKSSRCKLVASSDDILSSCEGDDKVFSTLVGNSDNIVILSHSSGATSSKWAETIGYYNKEEASTSYSKGSMRHSPFSLFPGKNNTTTTNYNIKREYIVKPEQINRMVNNEVYFYRNADNKLIHTFV